jgi:hypothetical protein
MRGRPVRKLLLLLSLIGVLALPLILREPGSAIAVNCSSNPFLLVPGTTASATQVMANFNNLLNCANTTLGTFSGPASSTNGNLVCFNGTGGQTGKDCPAPGAMNAPLSNPAGTTNLTPVMIGLGVTNCIITATRGGRFLFMISGNIGNSINGDGFQYQLYYGSGPPPANGAAITGTAVNSVALDQTGGFAVPFAVQGVVINLVVGTTYWFDLALGATAGGTASVTNLTCSAIEF